jgi:hypothetical protein
MEENKPSDQPIVPVGEYVPAERAIAYFYKDERTKEEYPVYEGLNRAWWMDGGVKLHLLLTAFRRGELVKEACETTAITYEQYKGFRFLHQWLPTLIRSYRHTIPNRLKNVILRAALGTPEELNAKGEVVKKAVPGNAKIALGAYRIFAVPEDDPDFAQENTPIPISPGGSVTTLIDQSFRDEEGNLIMSRKMAEHIKNHDNSRSNPPEPNGEPAK